MERWFEEQGFRLVTTSQTELLRTLDDVLMSHDEYHAEWWRRQPMAPSTHTFNPLDKQVHVTKLATRTRCHAHHTWHVCRNRLIEHRDACTSH